MRRHALLWPPAWRDLARSRAYGRDAGVRFCLAWMVPVFIGFSLISDKQPQYLLPLFAAFVLVALALLAIPNSRDNRFRVLAIAMAVLIGSVHIGIAPAAAPDNDLRPIGRYLHTLQDRGTPIAHLEYHGQFQFVGPLEIPLTVIQANNIDAWFTRHPDGKLIAYSDNWQPSAQTQPKFTQPYRSNSVAVWGAAAPQPQKPKP